jgi:hypothetical protein
MRKLIIQTTLYDEQYSFTVFTDIMKVIKADGQGIQHIWER